MAVKKVSQEATVKQEAKTVESVYSVSELAGNAAKVFGANVRSECVEAALKSAGKDLLTVTEAKKIVNEFMKREVK